MAIPILTSLSVDPGRKSFPRPVAPGGKRRQSSFNANSRISNTT